MCPFRSVSPGSFAALWDFSELPHTFAALCRPLPSNPHSRMQNESCIFQKRAPPWRKRASRTFGTTFAVERSVRHKWDVRRFRMIITGVEANESLCDGALQCWQFFGLAVWIVVCTCKIALCQQSPGPNFWKLIKVFRVRLVFCTH
jgi:hypothetical protein